MKRLGLVFSLTILFACAGEDARYRSNADLERPPELPIDIQASEQAAFNEPETPKRRQGKGLKSDVYKVEDSSNALKIKRNFDEAWNLVGRAIQQKDLKIPDQDRSKGNYYVYYDGGSLFGSYSLFGVGDDSTYLVKVESEGDETKVTVSFANKEEQSDSRSLKDSFDEAPEDLSSRLLELLYDTLHDDVKDDSAF